MKLTRNASSAPEDVVQGPCVVIKIFHELHLFAFFGKSRIVNQLGSLDKWKTFSVKNKKKSFFLVHYNNKMDQ